MEKLITYFNTISPLKSTTWQKLSKLFRQEELVKDQYFVKVNQVANQIGFLETGVVRAFFISAEGKEYNKQFFVGQSIIGAYSSLLTSKPNLISQQALTDCVIYTCNYTDLIHLFDEHQDLERLARKIAEYYFIEKEKRNWKLYCLTPCNVILYLKRSSQHWNN